MRIDAECGLIEFPVGTLGPTTRLEQFLDSPLGRSSERTLTTDHWQHYAIDPEPGIAGTILFKGDEIDRVFLAMSEPSDAGGDWNEDVESRRKDRHDAWLRLQLGEPPYEYPWGQVASEYDSKGCASEIIVVYDR